MFHVAVACKTHARKRYITRFAVVAMLGNSVLALFFGHFLFCISHFQGEQMFSLHFLHTGNDVLKSR